jgi:hypothetical protein
MKICAKRIETGALNALRKAKSEVNFKQIFIPNIA